MLSKSARYYRDNPKARKKKAETDKKINSRPEQRKKRSELVKENRKRGTYGNGDGKDVSHTKKGFQLKSEKSNRGSKKDMPGDRRSRGNK